MNVEIPRMMMMNLVYFACQNTLFGKPCLILLICLNFFVYRNHIFFMVCMCGLRSYPNYRKSCVGHCIWKMRSDL